MTAPACVDDAVAFIAAASEAQIRASMSRYRVTEIKRKHTSAWRSFFHDLAYEVSAGNQTPMVGHLVARRVATGCAAPAAVFDRLVEAVRDLTAYTASREAEGHWLVSHRIDPTEEARETYLGVIDERIEHALDELLAGVA